jgi:hypothetical protein
MVKTESILSSMYVANSFFNRLKSYSADDLMFLIVVIFYF